MALLPLLLLLLLLVVVLLLPLLLLEPHLTLSPSKVCRCGQAKPAFCEWSDSSFGDRNAARSLRFQAECERRGLFCPR